MKTSLKNIFTRAHSMMNSCDQHSKRMSLANAICLRQDIGRDTMDRITLVIAH